MSLFSNKQQQPSSQEAMAKESNGTGPAPGQINMIAEGTVFEGTLRAAGDVRISGRIVGALQVEGKVIVTQEGVVEGELRATSADVAGSVQGQIEVEDRLVLRSTAQVESNIKTARFVMEEGALFGGKCEMGGGRAVIEAGRRAKVLPEAPREQQEEVLKRRSGNMEAPVGTQHNITASSA